MLPKDLRKEEGRKGWPSGPSLLNINQKSLVRMPRITRNFDPPIFHTTPKEFAGVVQRLTGQLDAHNNVIFETECKTDDPLCHEEKSERERGRGEERNSGNDRASDNAKPKQRKTMQDNNMGGPPPLPWALDMSGPGGNMGSGAPANNMPPPQFNKSIVGGGGGGGHYHGGGILPRNNIGQTGRNYYTGGGGIIFPQNNIGQTCPNYYTGGGGGIILPQNNIGQTGPNCYTGGGGIILPQNNIGQTGPNYNTGGGMPPNGPTWLNGNHQYQQQQPHNYVPNLLPYNQQPNYYPNMSLDGNRFGNNQQHQNCSPNMSLEGNQFDNNKQQNYSPNMSTEGNQFDNNQQQQNCSPNMSLEENQFDNNQQPNYSPNMSLEGNQFDLNQQQQNVSGREYGPPTN